MPDLTHTLRRQPGVASMSGYEKEPRRPVDPEALRTVVEWCTRTGRSGSTHPDGPPRTNA